MRSPGAQQAKRGGRPTADEAAFGHADGSVTLVDLVTGSMRTLSGQADGGIDALSFSRDGRTLATGEETGTVAVWDVRSGALRESYAGHAAAVRAAVFSPDGRTLYTADYDGSVIAWDVTGARRLGQPFTFAGGFSSGAAAVSHDGSLLAVSPGPDRVALLRAATRAPLDPLLRSSAGDVGGIAFSPDGKLVAAAGSRQVVVWNTTTKKTVRIVSLAGNGASKVEFTPDGRTFAIGRSDGVAALYDARTGRQTGALAGEGSIDDIDFNPDGKLLATASLTGVVTLWDVARQTKLRDLPGAVAVYAVRFSPDGKLVAVGDSSGAVVLWDAAKGRRVGEPLVGHAGGVDSIDFSPDGKTLATSTDDGNLRLWDVATRSSSVRRCPARIPEEPFGSSRTESTSSESSDRARASSETSIPRAGRRRRAASLAETSPAQNGPTSSAVAASEKSARRADGGHGMTQNHNLRPVVGPSARAESFTHFERKASSRSGGSSRWVFALLPSACPAAPCASVREGG